MSATSIAQTTGAACLLESRFIKVREILGDPALTSTPNPGARPGFPVFPCTHSPCPASVNWHWLASLSHLFWGKEFEGQEEYPMLGAITVSWLF